jgi:hypothetical protein
MKKLIPAKKEAKGGGQFAVEHNLKDQYGFNKPEFSEEELNRRYEDFILQKNRAKYWKDAKLKAIVREDKEAYKISQQFRELQLDEKKKKTTKGRKEALIV